MYLSIISKTEEVRQRPVSGIMIPLSRLAYIVSDPCGRGVWRLGGYPIPCGAWLLVIPVFMYI